MKQKIKILAMCLMMTTVALGQGQDRPGKNMSTEERAQKRAETLKAKLKLTDAQYSEVYKELIATGKQMETQREVMRKMREDHDVKMKSILTPEQYSQMKAMQDQRKERMRNRYGSENNEPEPDSPTQGK